MSIEAQAGTTSTALVGRCLCGAVTIRVAEHDPELRVCHCAMCRRWTGSLYAMFAAGPEGLEIDGPVTRYRSSAFSERAFCGSCGSHLWLRDDGDEAYELMPGLFEAARAFPLVSEIYTDRAIAALRLPGEHTRHTRSEYEACNPFVSEEDLP
ncbi:GFA family protein [Roseivivax sp. GX 12232]|uniref:GFA family protein n=1 Tax=Roseivivax sp. GX 12232 TaxID=2900547 RepID=UPI001E3E45C1|nr:GFA family protein [Roseivivax sp. GX 12232]